MGLFDKLRNMVKSENESANAYNESEDKRKELFERLGKSAALNDLVRKYALNAGGYCDLKELKEAIEKGKFEDPEFLYEIINLLNIRCFGANSEPARKMLTEVLNSSGETEHLINQIKSDAIATAKSFGYIKDKAPGYISLNTSFENYRENKRVRDEQKKAKQGQAQDIIE